LTGKKKKTEIIFRTLAKGTVFRNLSVEDCYSVFCFSVDVDKAAQRILNQKSRNSEPVLF